MKFAHLADCHVGGWREPSMRDLNHQAFSQAIDRCLSEKVDFVILAGDLFNTAFPAVDSLALVTRKLKHLHNNNIAVYAIPGSHDFSPAGKTMLDVLEEAGLMVNVARARNDEAGKLHLDWSIDQKTGVKLTGMLGKKGGLDADYYRALAREELSQTAGHKVFVFHCSLTELKPKELESMDAMPASLLPEGFDYYAGGHVHIVETKSLPERQNIVYPGPTFPNNFAELEKLGSGSFVLVEDWKPRVIKISTKPVILLAIDAEHKSAPEVTAEALAQIRSTVVVDSIVLIRASGCLSSGRPSDVAWQDVLAEATTRGAFVVLRNTTALVSQELEEVKVSQSVEDVEKTILEEHAGKIVLKDKLADSALANQLMNAFSMEKQDGEKTADFEKRLKNAVDAVLGLE